VVVGAPAAAGAGPRRASPARAPATSDAATARRSEKVRTAWFAPPRNLRVVPNAAGVLTTPIRLLIDDTPVVAAAPNVKTWSSGAR
jgi:hypothetical protein